MMMKRLFKSPFHPLLFALYPTISLFAFNLGQVTATALWRPLAASLILVVIVLAVALLAFRNIRKASLFASLCLVLFFAFEPLRGVFLKVGIQSFILGSYRYYVPLLLLVVVGVAVWLLFKKTSLAMPILIVNVMTVAVFILPVFQITSFYANQVLINMLAVNRVKAEGLAAVATGDAGDGVRPDIYFIILDMYGRADRIQEEFAFDNTPFVNQLKSAGFYVAPCSTSNYSRTTLSLSSILNFNYLDALNGGSLPKSPDQAWLTPLIAHSQARQFLSQSGYTFVSFQNGFPFLNIKDADVFLAPTKTTRYESGLGNFELVWLEKTPFNYFLHGPGNRISSLLNSSSRIQKFGGLYTQTLFTLETLDKVPTTISGPKFVYAHIILPHPPYIFTPDGAYTEESRFNDGPNGAPVDDASYKLGYINQVKYVNSQIMPIVLDIIHNSKTPPVIMIMGDHGFWGDAHYRMPNLSAYYLPGVNYDKTLYPSISPVNAFRVVFDQYFGANYPLLEDRSFFSATDANVFDVTEYTNRVADCSAR